MIDSVASAQPSTKSTRRDSFSTETEDDATSCSDGDESLTCTSAAPGSPPLSVFSASTDGSLPATPLLDYYGPLPCTDGGIAKPTMETETMTSLTSQDWRVSEFSTLVDRDVVWSGSALKAVVGVLSPALFSSPSSTS